MNLRSFELFEEACAASGSELTNAAVVEAGNKGASSFLDTVEPSPIYAALIQAGQQLRKPNRPKLATRAIDLARVPQDIASVALARIINAQIDPGIVGQTANPTFQLEGTSITTCAAAEPRFARTILGMKDRDSVLGTAEKSFFSNQILVDEQGPLAFHKNNGTLHSTLALRPISIMMNGKVVPFPAGSIMSHRPQSFDPSTPCYMVNRVTDSTALAFHRLSAFAIDPAQRPTEFQAVFKDYADPRSSYFVEDETTRAFLTQATLADITDITSQATEWLQEAEQTATDTAVPNEQAIYPTQNKPK